MTNSSAQIDQIAALLKQSIIASDERMTRLEETMERQNKESNERMTRVEQVVESNNKFLEAFSTGLSRYTDTMNNFVTRIDGVIATSNQDRDEIKTHLNAIQKQVSAVALPSKSDVTKGDQPQP